MDSATIGLLVGGIIVGLLVVGGSGSLVVRARRRHDTTAAAGSDTSEPQLSASLPRTAPIRGQHVEIRDFAFHPQQLQVQVGTTVTWTNQDSAQHTVTFRNGMADSGLLSRGQTYRYTFAASGSFAYYCTVHPNMVGTVVVTAG